MGAVGKSKVVLWIFTIFLMFGGSLVVFILNKPKELEGLGNKTIVPKVWYNAIIALHAVYIIGVGFELISRAYLVMVGSQCSEQRRGFLCCFVYSMSAWWKLMMILGCISLIIVAGLTALIILLEGFNTIKAQLVRLAITVAVGILQVFFSIISFVTSKRLQKIQDKEDEELHGPKKPTKATDASSSAPVPPATIIEREKEKEKESLSQTPTQSNQSAIVSSH